jgi:pimeloyl-ACP methyl ester carboxylesterase
MDGGALPHVEGVRHRDVHARGARFHVAEAGPQDGPPVVLLHGWPQHWYLWRDVMPALAADGRRVIAPDLRGFGWSEATAHGYGKESLAADVLAVLDQLGVNRFRLAGHDWGGWISFLLGLFHPDRVERLVLVNCGHGYTPRDLKTLRAQLGFWYMPIIGTPGLGPALMRSGALQEALRRWNPESDAWTDEEAAIFLDRIDPHVSQQVYGSFVFREAPRLAGGRYRRHRLRPPTLMLHGDADRAIRPDILRGFEDHADDMRLELLPGLGHFCIEQAPEVVVPRITAFLE